MSTPFQKLVFSNYLYVLLMSAQLSSNLTLLLGAPRHSRAGLVSGDAELRLQLHRARKHFFNAYCRLSSNTNQNKLMLDMLQVEQKINLDNAQCLFKGAEDFEQAIGYLTRAYKRAKDEQPRLAKEIQGWIQNRPAWISPQKSYGSSTAAIRKAYGAQPTSVRRILQANYAWCPGFNAEFLKIMNPENLLDTEFFKDILETTQRDNTLSKFSELCALAFAVHAQHPSKLTHELELKAQSLARSLKIQIQPLKNKGKV